MEIKLNVNIGATLQVKNAKGEWDWIKPEVGCEIKLIDGEIVPDNLPVQFATMWDDVVGPQFKSVVDSLLNEQIPVEEYNNEIGLDATETVTTSEDEYY